MKLSKYILVLVTIVLCNIETFGQWSISPYENNPLTFNDDDQRGPDMIDDGLGNFITTFTSTLDNNTGLFVFAQKFSKDGNVMWNENGIKLTRFGSSQRYPKLVSDEKGGAIIVWDQFGDVYAQRLDSEGNILWDVDGILVQDATYSQTFPEIVTDGSGGAIITWYDNQNGNYDVFAQRINSFGDIKWDETGVQITSLVAGQQSSPRLIADGQGGAIITWQDSRDGDLDIYAQKFNDEGEIQWTENGVIVSQSSGHQLNPNIISNGAGGAIITWHGDHNGDYDIYAQNISPLGYRIWRPLDGLPICEINGKQLWPDITSDNNGGAFISWHDERSGDYDVYAQYIDLNGQIMWAENGISVSVEENNQWSTNIINDGSGGIIVSWQDFRNDVNTSDIYIQRINKYGINQWTKNGVAATLSHGYQYKQIALPDGDGGAYIIWDDNRAGNNDIFAQKIDKFGYLGNPEPIIETVRDVAYDQGGKVNILWHASDYDIPFENKIEYYSIWRSLQHLEIPSKNVIKPEKLKQDFNDKAFRITESDLDPLYWEWIGNTPAHNLSSYGFEAKTQFDSTNSSNEYTKFMVSAHTSNPYVYWDSEIDSGYSVDNLSPKTPQNLSVELINGYDVVLRWSSNNEDNDLKDYIIYRSVDESFIPDISNIRGIVTDTSFIDSDLTIEDDKVFYRISSRDVHDNMSEPSEIVTITLTSLNNSSPFLPNEYQLSQNYPNPFNPATIIKYAIPETGDVELKIFDALGREIAIIVEKEQTQGYYEVEFDASEFTSGTYFYRLQVYRANGSIADPSAGLRQSFVDTKKMILLK